MNDHDVLVGHEKIQHFGNVTTEEITQIIQPWGLPQWTIAHSLPGL